MKSEKNLWCDRNCKLWELDQVEDWWTETQCVKAVAKCGATGTKMAEVTKPFFRWDDWFGKREAYSLSREYAGNSSQAKRCQAPSKREV